MQTDQKVNTMEPWKSKHPQNYMA